MDEFDRRVGAPAHAYQEYYRAYSMAMLPGKERLNVSYGGKSKSNWGAISISCCTTDHINLGSAFALNTLCSHHADLCTC